MSNVNISKSLSLVSINTSNRSGSDSYFAVDSDFIALSTASTYSIDFQLLQVLVLVAITLILVVILILMAPQTLVVISAFEETLHMRNGVV